VNTARIDPRKLYIVGPCLHIASDGDTKPLMAYCVMTGMVTKSFLLMPTESRSPHLVFINHKLTIAPFEQDFRHDTAIWGQLFGFHVISGSISMGGFSFTIRAEG
jgi:hypothetical protein